MHLKPTNQAIQYNLALSHMQAAALVLKKVPAATSSELRAALHDLATAVKYAFSSLTTSRLFLEN